MTDIDYISNILESLGFYVEKMTKKKDSVKITMDTTAYEQSPELTDMICYLYRKIKDLGCVLTGNFDLDFTNTNVSIVYSNKKYDLKKDIEIFLKLLQD